jgi:hypothetical protein
MFDELSAGVFDKLTVQENDNKKANFKRERIIENLQDWNHVKKYVNFFDIDFITKEDFEKKLFKIAKPKKELPVSCQSIHISQETISESCGQKTNLSPLKKVEKKKISLVKNKEEVNKYYKKFDNRKKIGLSVRLRRDVKQGNSLTLSNELTFDSSECNSIQGALRKSDFITLPCTTKTKRFVPENSFSACFPNKNKILSIDITRKSSMNKYSEKSGEKALSSGILPKIYKKKQFPSFPQSTLNDKPIKIQSKDKEIEYINIQIPKPKVKLVCKVKGISYSLNEKNNFMNVFKRTCQLETLK